MWDEEYKKEQNKNINLLDESTDDFKENLKIIKENKLKLTNINKYLVKTVLDDSTTTCATETTSETKKLQFSKLRDISSQNVSNANDISKYFLSSQKTDVDKAVKFSCPLCSQDLGKFNEDDRQVHVNKCLDQFSNGNIKSNKQTKKIENFAKKDEELVTDKDERHTRLCQEQQVTNLELTKEELERNNKKFIENVLSEAVLNCPICGKLLQTLNSRNNHLKKCANDYHIRSDSLVELVKGQQEKLVQSLEKGLIPNDVYMPKKRMNNQQAKRKKQPSRIAKMEEPKTAQDEELQMAIALSNSLTKPESTQFQLIKQKHSAKQLPTLQLYDQHDRERVLSERLTVILDRQIKFETNALPTGYLIKTKFDSKTNYLWDKCRYFAQTSDSFYVKVFVTHGSFRIGGQLFATKDDQTKYSNIEVINTQTAFLLADLNNTTQLETTQNLSNLTQSKFNVSIATMNNNNNDDEIPISSDTNDSSIICLEPTISTTTNHMIKSTQMDLTQPNSNISKFQMLFEETIISGTDSSSQEANAENHASVCDESSNLQECLEQNVFEETVFIDEKSHSVDKLSKSEETDMTDDNHRMSDSTIILDNDSNESYRANVSRKRKSRQFQDDIVVDDDDNHDADDQKIYDNMTTRSKIIKLDDGASVDDEDLPDLNADQVYCNQIVDTNFDNQNDDANFDEIWHNFNENQADECYQNYSIPDNIDDCSQSLCENEEHVAITIEQTENVKPTAFDDEVVTQKLSACPNKYIENLKNNFKAPQTTTPKLNNKPNDGDSRLTSPLTPMPNYTTMNTPILKNQLKTFGLKVLPRKQAVKKLVEIYEYTHRKKLSLIKSKSCSSLNALIDSTSEASNEESGGQQAKSIFKPTTSKKGKLKKTLSQTTVRTTTTTATSESVPCSQGDAQQNNNLQQFEMHEADVLTTDCLNESEIKLKIKEFLLNNEDLHTKILNYEPLEFDKIYADVKQLGFKISNKLLMRILDEFCITFTLKNIKSRVNKAKSHKKY